MIASQDIVRRAVEFIKSELSPNRIYLFGSYASGNPREDSDMDFLIIKSTDLPRHKRAAPLYSLKKTKAIGAQIPMDFLVYTPEEFMKYKDEINSVVAEAIRNGMLVYER